ncbi:MAG TPA: DUF2721 domain-containing protein [Gammaproteobacteria bacterium]|nr:DUF2721 domain-containing protein [Gammaproteobacteria bacterium]
MQPDSAVSTISHVIQLSVAPVFLLAGVAGMLNVVTNRLGRIVDRFRVLESTLPEADEDRKAQLHVELARLSQRARLVHWAIILCTLCALLISSVVAVLFLDSFLTVNISSIIAGLFIAAMLALIGGLLCFLREVAVATRTLPTVPKR